MPIKHNLYAMMRLPGKNNRRLFVHISTLPRCCMYHYIYRKYSDISDRNKDNLLRVERILRLAEMKEWHFGRRGHYIAPGRDSNMQASFPSRFHALDNS